MRFTPFATIRWFSPQAICLLLLLCLAGLGLPHGATAAEQAEPDKLSLQDSRILYQAQQHFQKTDYRQCCRVLEEYLQGHPGNRHGQFLQLLGNSYFRMKDFKQAQAAYKRGLELHPQDPMFHLNLALALENDEQWRMAGEQYISAYGLQKESDPQLLYQAASLLTRTKQYRRAAEVLGQLIKAHPPARTEWLELQLYVNFELQDYPAAIRVTEQLLAREPEKVAYWQQLAGLQLHCKQYLSAAAAYEVAYQVREPSRQDLEQLADLYLYLNLPLRAAETLERIATDKRSRADLERLARLYWRGGLPEKANRCLNRILDRWPDAQAYQLKAQLLYEQSAYKQTLQLLETACDKYPEHAELHLQRGFAAWQLEDWNQAAKSFTVARRFKRTRGSADAALEIIEVMRSQPANIPQTAMHRAP